MRSNLLHATEVSISCIEIQGKKEDWRKTHTKSGYEGVKIKGVYKL